jgi:polyisoprenoid-binding protein YceI
MLFVLAAWQPEPAMRYVLTEDTKLWVEGTSTVHDWRCDAAGFEGQLDIEAGTNGIAQAEVTVPVDQLECKNGTMNKKTRNALKSDDHPAIHFVLDAAEVTPGADGGFSAATTGRLTIAGQTHTVELAVEGRWMDDGRVQLTGALPLLMSDFGVDPPTAMLGTLKTRDAVTVHFEAVAAPSEDL